MEFNQSVAVIGLNLDNTMSSIPKGMVTWALNAQVDNFNGEEVTYQNEQSNQLCTTFPPGYQVIGTRNILEENFAIMFLHNHETDDSEIGKLDHETCTYTTIINAKCLNFSIESPIHKHAHRNTNCGLEIYWVDGRNRARFIQLEKLPYKEFEDPNGGCSLIQTAEIDCNKLNLQPNFAIPIITLTGTDNEGQLLAGSYQFAVQYANALGEPYTSFYNVTNPAPVFDGTQATQDFNFPVNKAIKLTISDIDTTGIFDYINLAVVKTINNISSVDLVGTYQITEDSKDVLYTGQQKIKLDINDIFQKYDIFDRPADLTTAQDTLILSDIATEDRLSYQLIANQIKLKWGTIRIPEKEGYKDTLNSTLYRGYMRDEVYPFEIVFILKNGYQTDGFHIPGRAPTDFDLETVSNLDTQPQEDCEDPIPQKRWQVYNTASVTNTISQDEDECYRGEWQSGEFSYWESTETYPCNPVIWGSLSDKPIRHHKFPDSVATHIHDNKGYIYPIALKIDNQQIIDLIGNSTLTQEQKDSIKEFKIVRGNRVNNSSITAKGLFTNVLKYSTLNNKIDATTGSAGSSNNSAETSTRRMIGSGYDYTHKAHIEANKYAFFSLVGTITIGRNAEQNHRYNRAEDLIKSVRDSQNLFTQQNVDTLQAASNQLQAIIDNSGGDTRGKAHSQAAKALIDGAIQVVQAEIDLLATLNTIDPTAIQTDDSNNFAYFPNYLFNDVRTGTDGTPLDFFLDNTIVDEDSKERYTFHSPDTSFYQPYLGNTIKLETIEYGTSSGHISEVQKHARYQFISSIGYITALIAGVTIGFGSGSYGIGTVNVFNGEAMFAAYQTFLDILYKTIPKKNFANSFNAVGKYSDYKVVPNNGNKQRSLDIKTYLSPGMINVNDKYTVNNYQRESSVYLKTNNPLPYTHETAGVPKDSSKIAAGTYDIINTPISSYYGSIKNSAPNQYGQMYSYETVDTGYSQQVDFDQNYTSDLVFGGDTYINRFAYKSKIPFFLDNRVGFPDGADVSYNELSNVGRVKYWFSTDVTANTSVFDSFFATMTQHFFWPQISELYLSGVIFLFAYGIPYFYCESQVNVDMRQATNGTEGDFYPRVSSGIPDQWLQESIVSIQNDNSYWYNKSFSKQNKETFFSHIPDDYDFQSCRTIFPFRAVFSEQTTDSPNPSNRNNWRIFRPASRYDFPQNYGKLISLDGIETRQVLARFENKTLLYNALLTAPTSQADLYLGQPLFKREVPPQDYVDTDLGYLGTRNKVFIKTEFGHITMDSKRGQVFLIQGSNVNELTNKNVSKFFNENFNFFITKFIPNVPVDNHFNGIGLHGVYDNKYNRIIITKLDYEPIENVTYKDGKFYYEGKQILLCDSRYFINRSFTISYDFDNQSWISFHSYMPNYYIGESNYFYSGIPGSIWKHNTDYTSFSSFYGYDPEYILESPYSFKFEDEILQSVKDYTKVYQFTDNQTFTEIDDGYFNKLIIYNNQQCSGTLLLTKKPKNNLSSYSKYPIYNTDSKEILYTKSDNFYQVNTFWDMVKSVKVPIWTKSNTSLSIYKQLNTPNLDYAKRSFNKGPIRGKDLRIRFHLDDRNDIKLISQFQIAETQKSFK